MTTQLPWGLERVELTIGTQNLSLDRVADQDALMEALIAKGPDHPDVKDERIPYWGEVWPSALGLAQWLAAHPQVMQVGRVHEIGCGLALPGILCGFHAQEVILSDYIEEALLLTAHNWKINHGRPAQTALVDWRNPPQELSADLLMASDVAYEARSFAPLVNAFRNLCRPGGTILLAEPGRDRAKPWLQALPNEGFEVKVHLMPVNLRGIASVVNVLELHPR